MFYKYLLAFSLTSVISGCGTVHIPSDVPHQYEIQKSKVITGKTSRLEVHKRFGLPFITVENPPIEIYRVALGREADVLIGPVPFWIDTEEVILYAMVTFDSNDIVMAIDWDTFKHVGNGYSDPQHRMATLESDGFLFAAVKEGIGKPRKELLLAPPDYHRDAFSLPPPANRCALVMYYPQTTYKRAYFLDDELIGESPLIIYPDWDPDWPGNPADTNMLLKVIVSAGKHEIKATTLFAPGEFRREFECHPGNIFYAYPQLELVKSEPYGLWRWRFKYEGEISINQKPLNNHESWKRLLYYRGKWFGDESRPDY